ncbi:MAG TPA: ABC transporter ATP-binding protein/permease [Candidatus Eisenbergiella merdipullorum]|uniref:ABC transporter ATP-binding protein/permease n=1 Tax=Candidatus Eisenbergiella merdipullorum TaxID=2838553 RepID=A0A9D2I7V1_9FIRM|nr:ABC transporter ATP-binding protein/permease [Candidatus Eisenbergiella merdipullorum]
MIKKLGFIFTAGEKRKFFFLMVIIVMGSFLELLGVTVFMPFIDILMDTDAIRDNYWLSLLYNWFHFDSRETFLAAIAGCIIAIYIFKNVFIAWEKNTIYKFSYNIQRRISTKLLKAYMSEPYTFHLNKNVAVLQRSMQEDTDLFAKGIIHAMEAAAEVVVCIAIGCYLFVVSKSITLIVVGLLLICLGVFMYISKRYSSAIGRQSQVYKENIYKWMNQSLGGIKEIKVLNREPYFIDRYDAYFAKYVRGLRINRLIGILPKYVIETVCMTGLLLAVIVKMFFGQRDIDEFIPQLAVFAVAAFRLLPSVGKINEHMSATLYSAPSLDLIYHDLKEVEELPVMTEKSDKDWNFQNILKIKNVYYHYPDSEENVIEKASFEIERGTSVAFVGQSGAGKTTMVDIILGLLTPQMGKITADGMDIEKNISVWQKEIGYIPQTIYLSDDTIRNNIAFGIPEEEIDEAAVEAAVKGAQLYEFVESLPAGLDTYVGDRGVRLSGGQRQRIGIARALYHDPEILILDEATSALDNDTEASVMEAIDDLKGEKTMIIIAHRLTTIKNADRVFEVTGGKVIERDKEEVLQNQ